jgi:hypothetical protein
MENPEVAQILEEIADRLFFRTGFRLVMHLKRAYEDASPHDGFRVLVERFWPRDLTEKHPKIDLWLKDVAPKYPNCIRALERIPIRRGGRNSSDSIGRSCRVKHKSAKLLRPKSAKDTLTLLHAAQ